MTKATRESLFTVAYVVIGLIAVFIVGRLTFHHRFFHFPRPLLPFIIIGLTGSLMYAVVQMRGAGLAILLIALLYLVEVALSPPIRPGSLSAAAIFALPVGFALMSGAYAQKSLDRLKIGRSIVIGLIVDVGRFVVMGLIVGAGYGLMMALFLMHSRVGFHAGTVFRQALIGFELGAAMGLAFELVDLIGPRPKHKLAYDRPPV